MSAFYPTTKRVLKITALSIAGLVLLFLLLNYLGRGEYRKRMNEWIESGLEWGLFWFFVFLYCFKDRLTNGKQDGA